MQQVCCGMAAVNLAQGSPLRRVLVLRVAPPLGFFSPTPHRSVLLRADDRLFSLCHFPFFGLYRPRPLLAGCGGKRSTSAHHYPFSSSYCCHRCCCYFYCFLERRHRRRRRPCRCLFCLPSPTATLRHHCHFLGLDLQSSCCCRSSRVASHPWQVPPTPAWGPSLRRPDACSRRQPTPGACRNRRRRQPTTITRMMMRRQLRRRFRSQRQEMHRRH